MIAIFVSVVLFCVCFCVNTYLYVFKCLLLAHVACSVCVLMDFNEGAISCKLTSFLTYYHTAPQTSVPYPPSAQHGFVQSPERPKERGPLMTRGGPFHKYSRVPLRGDRFPAFSNRVSEVLQKRN